MQISYTVKNSKEVEIGEFEEDTCELRLASGRVLNLSDPDELSMAKKMIYSKVVTIPDMKIVNLSSLPKQ